MEIRKNCSLLLCTLAYVILLCRSQKECKDGTVGSRYRGTISVTAHDNPCQRWDSQFPHPHRTNPLDLPDRSLTDAQNFCRNPNGEPFGPWCYTTNPYIRKQYCDIPLCDCKQTEVGREYVGVMGRSKNGYRCQRWTSQTPHNHSQYDHTHFPDNSVADAQNFCRNPDGKPGGPWCFTILRDIVWDYCEIPRCECRYSNQGWEYMGNRAMTSSGLPCQRWDAQSPHEHSFTNTSRFPDGDITKAGNLCRNPDSSKPGGPWCFTMDPRTTWEYCKVRFCDCKLRYWGIEYTGKVSYTADGTKCQRWDSQSPHPHDTYPEDLPDLSLTRAENFCRNPNGDRPLGPWCYTTEPEVEWAYCSVPLCECKLDPFGNNYFGKKSMTNSGELCQRWDSRTPHNHSSYDPEAFPDDSLMEASNFCRNPDMTLNGPWCYTQNPNVEKDFCHVPMCDNYPDFVIPTLRPPHVEECKKTRLGKNYMGRNIYTTSGKVCQDWTSQYPHRHDVYEDSQFPDYTIGSALNYCRNPTNKPNGPWCFTTDINTEWEYCAINYCDCMETPRGETYDGHKLKTLSGIPCQRWDSQTPHNHTFVDSDLFPDATLNDAANHCRNPNGRPNGVWCFTTDPNIEWEYCGVPICECNEHAKGRYYSGSQTSTRSGKSCQRWDKQIPHQHKIRATDLTDGNLTAAGPKCRNPNDRDRPWCFTTDPDTRWEFCDIQNCRLDGLSTTPSPDNCPRRIGRYPTNLQRTGDNSAHLMISNTFPCDGIITAWEYWRNNLESVGYISTWRWDPDVKNNVILISKTALLPLVGLGRHIYTLRTHINVKRGDFIGVHYSRLTRNPMLPNSRGDNEVPNWELFDTINIARFNEDFKVGNKIDIGGITPIRSTYALQAWFKGTGPPRPTSPIVSTVHPASSTAPTPDECPKYIGRFPTDLPRRGGTWAHIMINNSFPCDGNITAWHYYRSNTETAAYVAVWRRDPEPNKYILIKQWELDPIENALGNIIHEIDKSPVKKGDCIGIHYSRTTKVPAISNSRGNDGLVDMGELFETINIPRFKEDFHEGNKLDFTGIEPIATTYALQAWFEGVPSNTKKPLQTGKLGVGGIIGIVIAIVLVVVLVVAIGLIYVVRAKGVNPIDNLKRKIARKTNDNVLKDSFDNPAYNQATNDSMS
ncbi:unnamed protein product [Owenia fusiformis]|uniref:Kringle domain-containing protein n=1 Tax=Owenia fusiformis TaxID=6347 RepID=A0A8S4N903_OWEFU|nr:unnamed protein product [Owenia fusiformis]